MICAIAHLVCSRCQGTPTHFCGPERYCDSCFGQVAGPMLSAEYLVIWLMSPQRAS